MTCSEVRAEGCRQLHTDAAAASSASLQPTLALNRASPHQLAQRQAQGAAAAGAARGPAVRKQLQLDCRGGKGDGWLHHFGQLGCAAAQYERAQPRGLWEEAA